MTTQEILQAAQGAKLPLALADADTKNAALEAMAVALIAAQDKILDANKQDVENARGRVSDVMLDRLGLTPGRLTDMAKGMREVAALPDRWAQCCAKLCAERPFDRKDRRADGCHRHHL